MLHEIESTAMHVGKLSAAVFAVNSLPDFMGVGKDGNMLTRNLKKGALLYVANEAVEEATLGKSNFRRMGELEGWKKLVDDSVFFGIGEAIDETVGFTEGVTNSLPQQLDGVGSNLAGSVVVASYLYALKWAGTKLENTVIKSVSSLFA